VIHHIVLFRLKPGTTPDERLHMTASLEALKTRIPEVVRIHVGANLSPRGQAYDMMLVSCFRTRRDLETYLQHPAHQHVVSTVINPLKADLIVGDLVVEEEQKG